MYGQRALCEPLVCPTMSLLLRDMTADMTEFGSALQDVVLPKLVASLRH